MYENGGSDPFWSDGSNLNMTRNLIIHIKEIIEKENSLFLLPDCFYREIPPELPRDYMARPDEIRENARKAMEMDIKSLSAMLGHISSETTIDIYSHVTDTMRQQAAVKIDRQISGTEAEISQVEKRERVDATQPQVEPYKPKKRKSGTGCVTMINDHLYEGRYSPKNAYGKRESHNIYAKTREECEEKLAVMISQVKSDIRA